MSKPKTINARIADFLKSYKSASSGALAITLAVMDHTIDHKDWSPMAKLVMSVDERMKKQMLQIIGKALGGVSGAVDTKAENGYRFKLADNFGPSDKMPELRAMVEAKESLFSEAVNVWLGKEAKAKAEFNMDKRPVSWADSAFKAGVSPGQFRDMLDKMQAEYDRLVAEKAKADGEQAKAA